VLKPAPSSSTSLNPSPGVKASEEKEPARISSPGNGPEKKEVAVRSPRSQKESVSIRSSPSP
jgi:hypothetical protein